MKKNAKVILAALAVSLVAAMMLTALVVQRFVPDPWVPEAFRSDPVHETLDLLQAEYIKPLDSLTLLNGAIGGMRDALAEKEIEAGGLSDLTGPQEEDQLMLAFEERQEKARELAGQALSASDLDYAAVRGLLEAVDDPYSAVFTPEEYQRFEEHMSGGNFGGIGVYIELDPENDDQLTVVEPIDGSPSIKAGLKAGDQIVAIDGKPTKGIDIEEAARRIRGPEGSIVVLTIKRGEEKPFDVDVERAVIHVRSVESEMLDGQIGYMKLRMFGESTGEEFAEDLGKLRGEGARALVLDLRNNGGGYIQAALDVVSHFVEHGETVVSVVNARTERNDPSYSRGLIDPGLPVAVLVNRFSASASEITAGALKDHKRALLVGETSFGKASVQQLHMFADGGALKYTVAHYLTPGGRDIHRRGIEPDVVVEMEPEEMADLETSKDPVLKEAINRLQKKTAAR